MSKLRKTILIIGILVVAVAASLGTALALYATGSMKTDPITLEFRLKEQEKIYDGTALKLSRVDLEVPANSDIDLVKGNLVSGHSIKVEFLGSQTDVGTSMSDASIKIYDENGFNVSNDYSVKVIGAELTVHQKSISVDMPDQQVVYNGSKVLFTEYNAVGELVAGHKIYGSTDAELLNVGDTLPADLQPLIFDVVGNDVTANYDIDFKIGEIEVIPRHISVRPVSREKVYDGQTVFADEIEYLEGSLVEGQYARYKINDGYNNKLTDAGTVETEVTEIKIYDVIGGEEVDVTENYLIDTYETGLLRVTPRPLTVTAKSGEFVYNGQEQSLLAETQPLSVEGLADGEEILSVAYAGARTDVGETANRITSIVINGNVDNYEKTLIDGTIKVTPYAMTVDTANDEKYYDGLPLFNGDYDAVLANDRHRIVFDSELPKVIDAGEKPNAYEVAVVDGHGDDVTDNYDITYNYGTLRVKKLPVRAILNSNEHVTYDGNTHTPTLGNAEEGNSAYFNVEPALEEGEEVSRFTLNYSHFAAVSDAREMRDAGEYRYTVQFSDKKYENNYTLQVPQSGYLNIDKRSVKVATDGEVRPYSGQKLEKQTYSLQTGELVGGHTFKPPLTYPNITTVGKIYNEYRMQVLDGGGADVTKNYDLGYTFGTLEVTALPITVTLKNYTEANAFTYSGKAVSLSAADAIRSIETDEDVTVADVIAKDDFSVVVTDGIVDAGTDYKYTVKITDKTFAGNFTLTVVAEDGTADGGAVEVKKLSVAVTLKDVERVYSGTEQYVDAYDAVHSIGNTTTGLTRDDLLIIYHNPALEHITVSNYPFTVVVSAAKERNYTLELNNLYDAARSNAMLKILKYEVEVTTESVAFVYDGTDRTSKLFSNGALANSKHKIEVSTRAAAMPKVRNVGDTAVNSLNYIIKDASNNDVTDNYSIIPHDGTLSVTPCPITITTGSDERAYNGSPLECPTASPNIALFAADELKVPADVPSRTTVGSTKNEFECDILDGHGVSAKNNYLITYIYGTLKVTSLAVTVTTPDGEQEYNGRPLSATDGIELSGLPAEIRLNYRAELPAGATPFSITDAGTAENKFKCAICLNDGTDVTENFDITYVYGTLKVNPLTINVLLSDFGYRNFEYDGTAKTFTVGEAITLITANGEEYHLSDVIPGAPAGGTDISFASTDFEIVYNSLILDAGTYTYSVKFANSTFAKNFVLEQTTPSVRVNKMRVELYLKDYVGADKRTYNGRAQTLDVNDAVTSVLDMYGDPVDETLLKPQDFTVIYPTEIRNVGDYIYRVKITYDYKAKNFIFDETTEGNVTVDQLNVTIALNNYTADYSGSEFVLPADALSVITATTVVKASDFTLRETNGKTMLNAGDYSYTAVIAERTLAQNVNVRLDTSDVRKIGKVTINKKNVDVTLNPLTLTYDGTVQKIDGARALEIDNPMLTASDFTITVKRDGAAAVLQNWGDYSYEATLNNANFTLGGTDTVTGGTVTVKKLQVTVTLNNFNKEYDGEEYALTADDAIYAVSGTLFDRDDFVVVYNDELTAHADADEYTLVANLTAANADKADNVEIKSVNGKIIISKRTVNVTTPTKSFVYNGQAQSETEPLISGEVAGHQARVAEGGAAEITAVGSKPNDSKYNMYATVGGAEKDVTANYKIIYNYGTLTVTPRALTITTDSDTKPYDGIPLTKDTYTHEGLAEGHTVQIPAAAELPFITDVGTVKNKYLCKVLSGTDDVTENYTITYKYGDLEITAVQVNVTLSNVTKTYIGTEIEVTPAEAIAAVDMLDVSEFTVTFNETVVNAGTYTFGVVITNAETAKNFTVNVDGSNILTVEKLDLAVELKNVEDAEYNGAVQTAKPENIVSVGANLDALTAASFTFVYPVEMLNAGEYTYGVRITDEVVRGNYNVTVTGGTYKIARSVITVTLKNYEETYNNTNFTVNVYDAIKQIDGNCKSMLTRNDFAVVYNDDLRLANNARYLLADGETPAEGGVETIDGKRYGTTKSVYSYGVELNDVQKRGNFTINVTGGNFKINKRKISITFANLEMSRQEYDDGGYTYYDTFDVTYNLSVSNATPLADGDSLIIRSAQAEGDGYGYLELYTIADYELTNAGCYEFSNLNGATPIVAKIILY